MIISHEREKLLYAISFFVRNTRKCGKIKLFKLLYFLDFEHFKQTGRSVTGMNYFAWPKGPVPVALFEEIAKPSEDFLEAFDVSERPVGDGAMLVLSPKKDFSDRNFTKREFSIMKNLVEEYHNSDAESMIEATHLENLPWDQIYLKEGKKQQIIPYELAPRKDEKDAIMRIAKNREELLEKLK